MGAQLVLPWLVLAGLHFTVVQVRAARGRAPGGELESEAAPEAALMPAAGGAIERMVIQFHRPGAPIFLRVYRSLFAALDRDTRVHVVVGDEQDRRLFEAARREWLVADRSGPQVDYVVVGQPITSWARDRFAVLEPLGSGPSTVLAPPTPMLGPDARANDWLVPWAVHAALSRRAHPSRERSTEDAAEFAITTAPFRFEGGDLIADSRFVYVATPLFERNPERHPSAVARTIERVLSRPVIRIGRAGHPAPSHHIGMFLTPLGEGRAVYGDPELGRRLVDGAGSLQVGGAALALDQRDSAHRPFAEVARTLRGKGIEAYPLPLLVSRIAHVWVSYNNVLMERRGGRLHVYMPTYGLPRLDDYAQDVYERLGAVVHPIPVEGIFRLGGTVRCLVAPLRRTR